jgi:hypothetical protein
MSLTYCQRHDSLIKNDEWISKVCNDPTCDFCFGRPMAPAECNHSHESWGEEE